MNSLVCQTEHSILTLTLNRPEKRNALNEDLLLSLKEALHEAKLNPSIKAILITGKDTAFSAGADIQKLKACDAQTGYEFARLGQSIFRQLETLGKPSLAAVNGIALGGGCELAMAATVRFASETAKFAQPEIKLGVIPGYGGTQRLARLIGKGRALDLCLTGRIIDAPTAEQWGLVSQVHPQTQLISNAYEYLEQLTQLPSIALSSIMETIHTGYDLNLDDAFLLEALHFSKTCATSDKTEGVAAFLEKRSPHFNGA